MPDKDWRVTLKNSLVAAGTLFLSTFTIREHVETPAGNLSGNTVAQDILDKVLTNWKACFTSDVRFDAVLVRELGTEEPDVGEAIANSLGTVSLPAGVLPTGVCAWCEIKTDLHTRSGRGGFHFPPPLTGSVLADDNHFGTSGTWWTNMVTFAQSLLSGWDVTHDVIVHHYSLRVWSAKRIDSHDAKSVVISPRARFVRSRMDSP